MALVDLNDSVIAQVRGAADIVDFVGQVTPLKLAGKSYKGLCPFHREKTPSFHVDRDKGLFYCFGCGTGGDVFKFLTLTERFTFPEAVEHVAARVGIELPRRKQTHAREPTRTICSKSSTTPPRPSIRPSDCGDNPAQRYLARARRAEGDRQEVRLRLRPRLVGLHPHAAWRRSTASRSSSWRA